MPKQKLDIGTHVISASDRRREVVEITQGQKNKKESQTHHEIMVKGEWRRKEN